MNDFTKEELEVLLNVLNIFRDSNNFISDELEGYLRIKIQSMINCEHKRTIEDSCMITQCCDCNMIIQ